jgi:hypothetical protein
VGVATPLISTFWVSSSADFCRKPLVEQGDHRRNRTVFFGDARQYLLADLRAGRAGECPCEGGEDQRH